MLGHATCGNHLPRMSGTVVTICRICVISLVAVAQLKAQDVTFAVDAHQRPDRRFIVVGNDPAKVAIHAIGPSLPVPNALADPTVDLYDAERRGARAEAPKPGDAHREKTMCFT